MNKFIGVKEILARPMTKKEYCEYRGWEVPENEDPNEEVYLVEYPEDPSSKPNHPNHKGYISMSPKHVFEKAYKETTGMTFGLAVEALKLGKKVARIGWNGANMFCFLVKGSTITIDREPLQSILGKGTQVDYRPHIDLKTADGSIATWAPSGSDALAEDWVIVD